MGGNFVLGAVSQRWRAGCRPQSLGEKNASIGHYYLSALSMTALKKTMCGHPENDITKDISWDFWVHVSCQAVKVYMYTLEGTPFAGVSKWSQDGRMKRLLARQFTFLAIARLNLSISEGHFFLSATFVLTVVVQGTSYALIARLMISHSRPSPSEFDKLQLYLKYDYWWTRNRHLNILTYPLRYNGFSCPA